MPHSLLETHRQGLKVAQGEHAVAEDQEHRYRLHGLLQNGEIGAVEVGGGDLPSGEVNLG